MNFLDAVKALQEGRCEGVKRKGWGFVYDSYADGINFNHDKIAFEHFLAEDWQLVNEVKQYEEVEVVAYYDPELEIFYKEDVRPQRPCIIELKGTIKREIKPKVKHREEVHCRHYTSYADVPFRAKFYAEWEE